MTTGAQITQGEITMEEEKGHPVTVRIITFIDKPQVPQEEEIKGDGGAHSGGRGGRGDFGGGRGGGRGGGHQPPRSIVNIDDLPLFVYDRATDKNIVQ